MESEIFNQVKESLVKNLQAPILSDKLTGKLSGINTDEISEILTSVYSRLVENRGRILEREKESSDKIHKAANWLTTSSKPGLLLYGNTGTGKTVLMESLKEVLKAGRSYDAVRFGEMFLKVQTGVQCCGVFAFGTAVKDEYVHTWLLCVDNNFRLLQIK